MLRPLALCVALVCLTGCPLDPLVSCADYDLCTTSSGSTSTSTGAEATLPTGGIQTVTGDDASTTGTTAEPPPPVGTTTTTGDTVVPPAVLSVMFTPEPLEHVGIIDVEVAAENASHVRMDRPGFPSVDLSKGQGGHFNGQIEILSGLSNGTHEATFVPRQDDVEGTAEVDYYMVAVPEAGSEILWDTIQDDGPGQVETLAVLGDDMIVGFATVFDGNDPRCYLHRRNLDGTYAGDPQILFPEHRCTAVDILTVEDTIYVLAEFLTDFGPRWRLVSMQWGGEPNVLRTGAEGERAHALARSAGGLVVACGTGPSPALLDKVDARYWPLNLPTVELDYQPPKMEPHRFDETVTDCAFRGEQLLLVGEVFGKHEDGDPNNIAPPRKRPFLIEIEGQGEPLWIVPGLGPGNATQGGAKALAIDDEGRAVVALYTCGDGACDPEPEMRRYQPGGAVDWQVTLPAEVSVFDVTWSPAGYAVVAGALGTGLSTQFLLQGYVPGTYMPSWSLAKGKQTGLNVAFAVVVAPGVVVGGGIGAGGFPAFAFVHP